MFAFTEQIGGMKGWLRTGTGLHQAVSKSGRTREAGAETVIPPRTGGMTEIPRG